MEALEAVELALAAGPEHFDLELVDVQQQHLDSDELLEAMEHHSTLLDRNPNLDPNLDPNLTNFDHGVPKIDPANLDVSPNLNPSLSPKIDSAPSR